MQKLQKVQHHHWKVAESQNEGEQQQLLELFAQVLLSFVIIFFEESDNFYHAIEFVEDNAANRHDDNHPLRDGPGVVVDDKALSSQLFKIDQAK